MWNIRCRFTSGARWSSGDNIGDSGSNRRTRPSRLRRPVASWLSSDESNTKSIRRSDAESSSDTESFSDEMTEDPNIANHAPAESSESNRRTIIKQMKLFI